jgi:hypothetical protein
MSAYPVIVPMHEQGVFARDEDGAYYVVQGNYAQVIVIGPMHFAPGAYVEALSELLDTHYVLTHSEFLSATQDVKRTVLDRGFVSLIASKGN